MFMSIALFKAPNQALRAWKHTLSPLWIDKESFQNIALEVYHLRLSIPSLGMAWVAMPCLQGGIQEQDPHSAGFDDCSEVFSHS
mgnify:CR=1 FL=1